MEVSERSNLMFVVYIVIGAFVMLLLLSVPLFPFWKVWQRLQTHHPDIWKSAGPFEIRDMLASPDLIGIFIKVLVRMEVDTALKERDPVIVKWARASMELVRMLPRTFPARLGYFIIFLYLTYALTKLLTAPFSH